MQTYDPHKTTPEVLQGSRHTMNMRVLVWSTVGVVLASVLILLAFFVLAPAPVAGPI